MTQLIVFYALATLITICSIMVISSKNPVTSAVFLVGDLFLLAGIYAMMEAHFVAAIQILIYAGAIMVLFVFVIMLLNLAPQTLSRQKIPASEAGVMILTILGFVVIGVMLAAGEEPSAVFGNFSPAEIEAAGGNTYVVGMVLFTKYLWPFELASILILLAVIASVVIAKKDKPKEPVKRRVSHGVR